MGRLLNDIAFAVGKKPRSVAQYINHEGRMTELPFEEKLEQGTPIFRIRVAGENRHRKWYLINPPYIDDLNRRVYVCPYWSLTSIDYQMIEADGRKVINDMNIYFQMALDNEFFEGAEFEKKRQEGKPFKKKPLPVVLIIVVGIVIVFIGLIAAFWLLTPKV